MFRGLTRFVFLRFLLPGPKHTILITSASSSPSPAFGRIWEVAMMKKSRHFLHLTKMWASFLLPGLQPVYESVLAVWWKIWPDRVTTFQNINGYKMAIWSQNCPNTTMTSFWHRNNQRVSKTPIWSTLIICQQDLQHHSWNLLKHHLFSWFWCVVFKWIFLDYVIEGMRIWDMTYILHHKIWLFFFQNIEEILNNRHIIYLYIRHHM